MQARRPGPGVRPLSIPPKVTVMVHYVYPGILPRTPTMNMPMGDCLTVGSLSIDLAAGVASRAGRVLKLWPKEFSLLVFLAQHADSVVTRQAIARNVWGDETAMWTNVIAVNVNGLRKALEREGYPTILHTVRGQGYMISELSESHPD